MGKALRRHLRFLQSFGKFHSGKEPHTRYARTDPIGNENQVPSSFATSLGSEDP